MGGSLPETTVCAGTSTLTNHAGLSIRATDTTAHNGDFRTPVSAVSTADTPETLLTHLLRLAESSLAAERCLAEAGLSDATTDTAELRAGE